MRAIIILFSPTWLLKLFQVKSLFPDKPFQFFIEVSEHILKQRKEGISAPRNDLVQLLMDARVDQKDIEQMNYDKMTVNDEDEKVTKKITEQKCNSVEESSAKKKQLTDTEIIANCVFFFVMI